MTLAEAVAAQQPLVARLLDGVAEIGRDPPGVTRHAFGERENAAQVLVAQACAALGLDARRDAATNFYATLPGRTRGAPCILLGSHLDSVRHGGNFDGAAGVVAGLAAIAALRAIGFRPAMDVTLAAFRCEEAVWFGLGLIGSRAALGILPEAALQAKRADSGETLAALIRACGGDPALVGPGKPLIAPGSVRCFLEAHIEQAPSLVESGQADRHLHRHSGNIRHATIRITGEDAHVGLPRRFRHDAALAGADLFVALDALWAEEEAAGRAMAFTIGRFHTPVETHEITKISGDFTASLDLRAYDPDHLARLERRLHAIVAEVAARRGVRIDLGPRNAAPVGPCDPALRVALAAAATRMGVATMPLGSPASPRRGEFRRGWHPHRHAPRAQRERQPQSARSHGG